MQRNSARQLPHGPGFRVLGSLGLGFIGPALARCFVSHGCHVSYPLGHGFLVEKISEPNPRTL